MNGSAEATAFERQRPALFALAYRMLGSIAEAEDVVQEAWVRLAARPPTSELRSAPAFLTTVVTRLCIDQLRSARARRESYTGPWLPEPLVDGHDDPADAAVLAESLSLAFLVLLEELSPVERAAFVLHDVFGYTYDEVAGIVDRTPVACRQMISRARRRVSERRRRFDGDRERGEELARQFVVACGTGDAGALMSLLAEDVVVWTDGGGKVRAAVRPVRGADRASRFLVTVAGRLGSNVESEFRQVNGEPGVVLRVGGAVTAVIAFGIVDGRIAEVRAITNPDKLIAVHQASG